MQADFLLDYGVLAPGQAHKVHLLVRIMAGPGSEQTRRPLNLSLVIDRSGSMAGSKIDYTRQAAQVLVQNLGASDTLSIVLYSDDVETLLPPEKVQRKDIINQRIAAIKPGGTTNLSGGWLEGCKLVTENLHDSQVNRVILMTDGLANRGVTDTQKLVTMVEQKLAERVSTTTMGLGSDFNEDLLMAMASAGGGAFYFIESPEVAPQIFAEELQGLLNVMGQNLTVTLEPHAGIELSTRQMNAYSVQVDGRRSTFRLGDVFAEEVKALMLEITVPPLTGIGQMQIANLRIEYDALTEAGTEHHIENLPVMVAVRMPGDQPVLPDPEVSQAVLVLSAAKARQSAIVAADQGMFDQAAQVLREAAQNIGNSGLQHPLLQEEQEALEEQAAEIEQGAGHYDIYSRKTMSTQAFYTMTSRHEDTMGLRSREQQRRTPLASAGALHVQKRQGVVPSHVTWKETTFTLTGDLIRIGRSSHNEITISAKGVSRFHCQIVRNGDQLVLEDLGSTNGTVMTGQPISQPVPLSVGDVVYLCDEKLTFHDGSTF